MPGLIIVLLDGLAWGASLNMRWVEKVPAHARQGFGMVQAEKPSISRPAYATLLTGLLPEAHGILANSDVRKCPFPTLFSRARDRGLVCCAAAYSWFFELCNGPPFRPDQHRLLCHADLPLANGLFYWDDAYPDAELFADAQACLNLFRPDFMLVHSMGIDYAGHVAGSESAMYEAAVGKADSLLAHYLPLWLADSCNILVMSDHGMGNDGSHDADMPECRDTPCWLLGSGWKADPPGRAHELTGLVAATLFRQF